MAADHCASTPVSAATADASNRFSTSEASFSSSNSQNKVVAALAAVDKSGGAGRWARFSAKEIAALEFNTHLLNEWLTSYNDEQRSYRSLSTKIETELREASVFANALPKPNMLVTAVALTSWTAPAALWAYEVSGSIRNTDWLHVQDSEAILAEERDVHKRTLTVKEFISTYLTLRHCTITSCSSEKFRIRW